MRRSSTIPTEPPHKVSAPCVPPLPPRWHPTPRPNAQGPTLTSGAGCRKAIDGSPTGRIPTRGMLAGTVRAGSHRRRPRKGDFAIRRPRPNAVGHLGSDVAHPTGYEDVSAGILCRPWRPVLGGVAGREAHRPQRSNVRPNAPGPTLTLMQNSTVRDPQPIDGTLENPARPRSLLPG